MFEQSPPLEALQIALRFPEQPIGKRMRAAYFLRQLYQTVEEGDPDLKQEIRKAVVAALSEGLLNEQHGSLMRHEFAYVMGQLRDEQSVPVLERVLQDPDDCVMVRHEAAEALGAIGAPQSQHVLRRIMTEYKDSTPELSDTCRLALNVIEWRERGGTEGSGELEPVGCPCMTSPYSSVDPAPPHPLHERLSFEELGDMLCDPHRDIFERYRAMFSLRNRGSAAAVAQLCRAINQDASSALLRHEVAYVLGQMQHPTSVEALEVTLRRVDEHMMVRHEAAEALGAIDGRWDDVERILTEFSTDSNDVVRESCLVALDAADYWGHNQHELEVQDAGPLDGVNVEGTERQGFSHQKTGIVANHFNIKT